MANLTKEERIKREIEEKEQLKKEVEAQVRLEMSESVDDLELKKENDYLKEQMAEMLNMIKELQEKNESNKDTEKLQQSEVKTNTVEDIDINTRISVTSITTGGVNMKTANDGSARHFRLESLGQTIPITYEHLINCIGTDRWLFEEGLVYINDSRVVREQYLEECYQKFLTSDKIKSIMDFDVDTIKQMVSSTTQAIQETIVTFVANKMNKGDTIDMNKVEAIGSSCNPKVDIREVANKLR